MLIKKKQKCYWQDCNLYKVRCEWAGEGSINYKRTRVGSQTTIDPNVDNQVTEVVANVLNDVNTNHFRPKLSICIGGRDRNLNNFARFHPCMSKYTTNVPVSRLPLQLTQKLGGGVQ